MAVRSAIRVRVPSSWAAIVGWAPPTKIGRWAKPTLQIFFAIVMSIATPVHADEIRLLSFDTPGGAAAYISAHQELEATNTASGTGGSMVWVSCPGEPPEAAGMAVLGGSYAEVLADPYKKAAYEMIMPPGHFDADGEFVHVEGEDRRFGTFAGREEML